MPWRNTFHCSCEEPFSHCLCTLHCVCKHLQSNEVYFLFWHLFFIRCTQAWHMLCVWFSTVLCGDCFQPCCHVPTLFAVIFCPVYCGLPKPCEALGRSGISSVETWCWRWKSGPVPGGGDLVMELCLTGRYCRCDTPDACWIRALIIPISSNLPSFSCQILMAC